MVNRVMRLSPLQLTVVLIGGEFLLVSICEILLERHTFPGGEGRIAFVVRLWRANVTRPFAALTLRQWAPHCGRCFKLSRIHRVGIVLLWATVLGTGLKL